VLAVGLPMRCRSAWDRDRQTRSDQRVSTMKRRAGATTTGKKCPTGTTLDTLGNRLRPDVPLQSTIVPRRRKPAETGLRGHPCSMGKNACPAHPARAFPGTPARAPGRRAERGSAVRRRPPLHGQADTRWRPVRGPGRSVSGPPRRSGRAHAWYATPPWQASRRPDGGSARFAPNAEWVHQTSAVHDGGARPPASVDQR
jgi:hypothetical protein